ncbi:MAG: asparagine synthase (glutamine-hydrolyzing) [Nitrospiraceae bacterium]|nr:MAG: asparagine synthase (glutamine-hydrolyzing) [Nitrospiraceae bacterium]
MCGIAGIICWDRQKIEEDVLLRMRDVMTHRGPDDSGFYINERKSVALGHRRLSIIDLSSLGHQPMLAEDGNVCLVYNGEIYNFLDIRKELRDKGYTFNSTSDTEVILKAYQEWGEQAFERFNGMYAFCLHDKKEDLLYLARDHAGIKPLYYSLTKGNLIFASETKAFTAFHPHWEKNSDWKIYLLTFGHMPEPFTTLNNVFMLPQGSLLRLDIETGKHEIMKFNQINFSQKIINEKDALEQVRDTFTESVKRHLISDAPIGVFLSGGIDSSLIALVANTYQKENLRTLSIIFDEKEYSEETYQDIVLKKMNSHHHKYLVTENDFTNNLENIFQAMDQPTIDGVNTYFIAKCAKEDGLKAVLSGLGGDELFGGYSSFTRIDHLWKVKWLSKNIRNLFKLSEFSGIDKFKRFSFLSMQEPLSFYLLLRGIYTPKTVSVILGCSVNDVQKAIKKLNPDIHQHLGKQNFVSCLETNLYMKNQLLRDTDVMSMRHSVEVRVPFLDRKLIETVFSIREDIKFRKDIPKFLLVKAFEHILPEEITTRKKQGFTFPFDVWIKKQGKGLFENAVSKGGINKKYADRVWNEFQQGNIHWSKVWAMVVAAATCPSTMNN